MYILYVLAWGFLLRPKSCVMSRTWWIRTPPSAWMLRGITGRSVAANQNQPPDTFHIPLRLSRTARADEVSSGFKVRQQSLQIASFFSVQTFRQKVFRVTVSHRRRPLMRDTLSGCLDQAKHHLVSLVMNCEDKLTPCCACGAARDDVLVVGLLANGRIWVS